MSSRGDCERLVDETVSTLGGLDILVNNAGGARSLSEFADLEPKVWDEVLGANLNGVFHCSQLAARRMMQQGRGGSIVVITSSAASIVGPRVSHYCTAKAGADMLARAMAYELAKHRITVNVVAPGPAGPTRSNQDVLKNPRDRNATEGAIPLGHLASPEDVAQAVLYLVSPVSQYVTGARITVDGGYTIGKDP